MIGVHGREVGRGKERVLTLCSASASLTRRSIERPSTWAATKQRVMHGKDRKGDVTQASAPGTGEEGGIGSEPRLVAAAAGTRATGGSGRMISGLVGTTVLHEYAPLYCSGP